MHQVCQSHQWLHVLWKVVSSGGEDHPPSLQVGKAWCCGSVAQLCLIVTPWTAASQASLAFTISLSLLKFLSIGSAMPSNHLILCHSFLFFPLIFPSIRVFFQCKGEGSQHPKNWSICNLPISGNFHQHVKMLYSPVSPLKLIRRKISVTFQAHLSRIYLYPVYINHRNLFFHLCGGRGWGRRGHLMCIFSETMHLVWHTNTLYRQRFLNILWEPRPVILFNDSSMPQLHIPRDHYEF